MSIHALGGVLFSPLITPDYSCAPLADAHGVGFGNPHRISLGTKGGTNMSVRTITLILALLCISVSLRAADEPLIGAWKLNVAKSKYSPGPTPKGATITYEAIPGGVKATVRNVDPQGKENTNHLPYVFDGKEYPSPESQTGAMFVNKRIDANTTERFTMKAGKLLVTMRRVVSKDGKTLTVTQKGTNENGRAVDNVQVYDKQ